MLVVAAAMMSAAAMAAPAAVCGPAEQVAQEASGGLAPAVLLWVVGRRLGGVAGRGRWLGIEPGFGGHELFQFAAVQEDAAAAAALFEGDLEALHGQHRRTAFRAGHRGALRCSAGLCERHDGGLLLVGRGNVKELCRIPPRGGRHRGIVTQEPVISTCEDCD